jgi:hypothetical protein
MGGDGATAIENLVGAGGTDVTNSFTGSAVAYGGGGGGCRPGAGSPSGAGPGGGTTGTAGNGGGSTASAVAGTGGGSGAAQRGPSAFSGVGGSGAVVIRFLSPVTHRR